MEDSSKKNRRLEMEKKLLSTIFEDDEEICDTQKVINSFPFVTKKEDLIEILKPLSVFFADLSQLKKTEFAFKLKELLVDFQLNKEKEVQDPKEYQKFENTFVTLQDVLSFLNDTIEDKS